MLPPKPKLVPGIEMLENKHCDELLAFLARRPIHHRMYGEFCAGQRCSLIRSIVDFLWLPGQFRTLEGVALVGHSTLIETESEAALRAV